MDEKVVWWAPFVEYAPALIGPAIAAFSTALVVWLRETIARRDETFRRRGALVAATREVQFIQAWVAASREVHAEGTSSWLNEQVRTDLARAYALVAEVRASDASHERKRISLRDVTRAVLLWGKLASPWARAGLVVYYLLVLYALLVSAFLLDDPPEVSRGSWIVTILVSVLFQAGVIWLWRSLLLWLDRRYRVAKEAIPGNDPAASEASSHPSVVVLSRGVWREGVLSEWRPDGMSWAGRIRFDDGTVTDWVPAENLRYPSEPHVKFQS